MMPTILLANLKLFQSAPAIAGERDPYSAQDAQEGNEVSIRARHCWRA